MLNAEQIKYIVDRFLGWKLPRDTFNPDCGISFDKKQINTHPRYPLFYEPTGTNLFSADQADAMVRYMVDGLPSENTAAALATGDLQTQLNRALHRSNELYRMVKFLREHDGECIGDHPSWLSGMDRLLDGESFDALTQLKHLT